MKTSSVSAPSAKSLAISVGAIGLIMVIAGICLYLLSTNLFSYAGLTRLFSFWFLLSGVLVSLIGMIHPTGRRAGFWGTLLGIGFAILLEIKF